MNFSEKLRLAREQSGLSQAVLAEIAGISQPQIHRWEHGNLEKIPSGQTLLKIADALCVPLRYLCDDRLDTPDQGVEAPPGQVERRIWELVQILGAERALARLVAMPESEQPNRKPRRRPEAKQARTLATHVKPAKPLPQPQPPKVSQASKDPESTAAVKGPRPKRRRRG